MVDFVDKDDNQSTVFDQQSIVGVEV